LTKVEVLQEFAKCLSDIAYYGEKYCEAFDQTQKKKVPLKVFPKQKDLLAHYKKHLFSVVLKPRQAGVSTVTALFCAHKIMFAPAESPQKILIVANKLSTANEFIKKIRSYIDSRPAWLDIDYGDTNNISEFELTNKSGAKATATSEDAMRGYTPTLLVMDEAAFIEKGDELWTSAAASLSTGGGAIFISTPNGLDALYYKTYQASLKNDNDFKIFEMNWWQDPRFNKDLTLKFGDQTIIPKKLDNGTWDFADVKRLIKEGYMPSSAWYVKMCRTYNGDQRKIAQELNCSFLGSGDNVFGEEYIKVQEALTCLPKSSGFFDNNLWTWEEPQENQQYLLAADVSRGDSDDFSSIEIFNVDTGEQAAEWHGKVPPDMLGVMINEIGLKYQALAIVDITGGMGQATVIKLCDLNYPYLFYSDSNKNNVLKSQMSKYKKSDTLIPGFIIGPNRTLAIQALELAIREGHIKIRSKRLIEELRTFVWINGKADHMRGYHDDLLIAVAMLLFVFHNSFRNVKRFNAQTLAMLNAWGVQGTTRPNFGVSPVNPNELNDNSWLFK